MQTKQDEKLDEVRAILQRLQRISTGTEDDDAADRAAASPTPAPNASEPRPQAPPEPAPPFPVKPAGIAIFAVAVMVLLAGAGFMLWPGNGPQRASDAKPRSGPATTAAITVPPPAVALPEARSSALDAERLAQAQALMEDGKVAEARQVLLTDLAERQADAALLLARSFDPNALHNIADPNAPPDAGEAERWYRHWSLIGGRDGPALDQDRLERIIRSMR